MELCCPRCASDLDAPAARCPGCGARLGGSGGLRLAVLLGGVLAACLVTALALAARTGAPAADTTEMAREFVENPFAYARKYRPGQTLTVRGVVALAETDPETGKPVLLLSHMVLCDLAPGVGLPSRGQTVAYTGRFEGEWHGGPVWLTGCRPAR